MSELRRALSLNVVSFCIVVLLLVEVGIGIFGRSHFADYDVDMLRRTRSPPRQQFVQRSQTTFNVGQIYRSVAEHNPLPWRRTQMIAAERMQFHRRTG